MQPAVIADLDASTQAELIEVHKQLTQAELKRSFAENKAEAQAEYIKELEADIADLEKQLRNGNGLEDPGAGSSVWTTVAAMAIPHLMDHVGPKLGGLIDKLVPEDENENFDPSDPGSERRQPGENFNRDNPADPSMDPAANFGQYERNSEN
jgi:hypothetical protein